MHQTRHRTCSVHLVKTTWVWSFPLHPASHKRHTSTATFRSKLIVGVERESGTQRTTADTSSEHLQSHKTGQQKRAAKRRQRLANAHNNHAAHIASHQHDGVRASVPVAASARKRIASAAHSLSVTRPTKCQNTHTIRCTTHSHHGNRIIIISIYTARVRRRPLYRVNGGIQHIATGYFLCELWLRACAICPDKERLRTTFTVLYTHANTNTTMSHHEVRQRGAHRRVLKHCRLGLSITSHAS